MEPVSSDPPVVSYRSPVPEAEADPRPASSYSGAVKKLLAGLTWAILAVVLLVWAVLGAVFWIPLLVRALLRFSINLIEAAFEGKRPVEAARILRNAVNFYRRGFVVAVEVVTREEVQGEREAPTTPNRLLYEVLWAILVWYLLFLWWGWIQASPLDLWNWLVDLPWRETFTSILGRFRW